MQYKYKVCKGQKVLALSTTLREAEAEARRVGGVVLTIGGRRNPADDWQDGSFETTQNDNKRRKVSGIVTKDRLWGIYYSPDAAAPLLVHIPSGLAFIGTFTDNATVADLQNIVKKMPLALRNARTQEEAVTSGRDFYTSLREGTKQFRLPAEKQPPKPEFVRTAKAKVAAKTAARVADKQTHEGASKFKLRPVGNDGPFDTPQGGDVEPSGQTYLATLLAPKCFAPVAYFFSSPSVYGYSPDLTREYTEGYFDGSEESADGMPRVHMSGLENYAEDRGKGIGPLAYMVMPFAALKKYRVFEVFSPEESGGPRDYTYRSKDADRAWENLIKAGIADQETESGTEYTSETVDLRGILEAGTYPLSDWDSVDRIDPRYVDVEGEKSGEEITIDKIHLRTVLLDRRTLHVEDDLWTRIDNQGLVNDNDAISPPADAWAEIDLLHCTSDEVQSMVEFCSKHGGSDQGDYLRELAGVIGTNPTYRKGTLDDLLSKFGLEVKTQNPRRKNPEAQSWIRKNKQAFWDSPEASKQAVPGEAKKNPKASKKLSANQQKKYLGTLTGAAREARAKEILHRREHRSNKPFKTDKGQQTKRSSHATKFAKKFGRAPADTEDASRLSGVSKKILDEVYARGMAAWQTGHRPGASQHAWAMARVESFLTGGPTSKTADADLARKKNPPDPEYATELGGGAFSKAYGRPPQAKDFRGTPIDAGPRGVEAITRRGGMHNFDSYDAGKAALILARKALIAKKNYAAAKYLPEITPLRLDQDNTGVREYVYAMPYYTQWEAAPYGSHPELAKFLRWALDKGMITGMVEMPEAIKRFMAKVDDKLRFFPNKDDAAEYKAEANNVAKALYAIHEAVHKMGVTPRRDYYGSDMHAGNFALDGEQLILLDPVAVDLPEKFLDDVWYKNGWAKKPPKQLEGQLYKLLKAKKAWPQVQLKDIGSEYDNKRWQEVAALLYPLLADAGPGTKERVYAAMRRLGAISDVSYDKENGNIVHIYAMIPATKFPDNAEKVLEAIEQGWWNPRESEKAREFLENLLKKQNPRKKNPERTWIPPAEVAAEARKALELRAKQPASNKCCTPVGIARAKQLANRQPVSETTLRRMKAYFDRHAVDAKGKGWKVDSKGWQAWLAWGSDAGREWCEKILRGL